MDLVWLSTEKWCHCTGYAQATALALQLSRARAVVPRSSLRAAAGRKKRSPTSALDPFFFLLEVANLIFFVVAFEQAAAAAPQLSWGARRPAVGIAAGTPGCARRAEPLARGRFRLPDCRERCTVQVVFAKFSVKITLMSNLNFHFQSQTLCSNLHYDIT